MSQTSKNLSAKVKKELASTFDLFDNVSKTLEQLDQLMESFRALKECVQEHDVMADYKDLDYLAKLEFLEENDEKLASLRKIIEDARELVKGLNERFSAIISDQSQSLSEEERNQIGEISEKLNSDENIQIITQ